MSIVIHKRKKKGLFVRVNLVVLSVVHHRSIDTFISVSSKKEGSTLMHLSQYTFSPQYGQSGGLDTCLTDICPGPAQVRAKFVTKTFTQQSISARGQMLRFKH